MIDVIYSSLSAGCCLTNEPKHPYSIYAIIYEILKGTTNRELNSEMLISKDISLDLSEQEALFLG